MARRRDQSERKALAAEVQRLLALETDSGRLESQQEPSADARRIVNALSFLRWVTQQHIEKMDAASAKSVGAMEAQNVLHALISGADHPVFDYMQALRSEISGRPSLSPAQTIIWVLAIAGSRVLSEKFGCPASEARKLVADRLRKLPSLKEISAEAIRKRASRLGSDEKKELTRLHRALLATDIKDRDKLIEWLAVRVAFYAEPPFLAATPDPKRYGFRPKSRDANLG